MAPFEAAHGPRLGALDASAVRRWVERTCAEQGLRVAITDPATIALLVVLLGAAPRPSRAVA